jgi:hypothetical protein
MQTISKRHHLGTLLGCLLLIFWVEQASINTYCQQTFHHPSPLENLNRFSLWQQGRGLGLQLRHWHTAVSENALRMDNGMTTVADHYLPAPVHPALPAAGNTLQQPKNAAASAPPAAKPENGLLLVQPGQQVLLAGDSMMQGVAPLLEQKLHQLHQISVVNLSKQSTGLAYPGFFDWPRTIANTLDQNHKIGLLVVLLGANDTWDMVAGRKFIRFRSPEWEQLYRARIRNILASARKHKVQVLWLGAPNMGRAPLNEGVHYLNQLYSSELQAAGQRYITTSNVLGSKDGSFNRFMSLPDQGEVSVRTADGVHFTRPGQLLLTQRVVSELRFE